MNDWAAIVSYVLDATADTMDHWSEQFDATVSRVPKRGVVDVTVYAPAELHLVDVIAKYVDSILEAVSSTATHTRTATGLPSSVGRAN